MSTDQIPVTVRDTALRTPHSAPRGPESSNSAARAGVRARVAPQTAVTQGDVWSRIGTYWTPPQVWAERPESLTQILRYAREGEWTAVDSFARYLGILWSWVAVAVSTVAYYAAWIVQRPGRTFTFLLIYVPLAHTPVGAWLPWPSWL